MFLLLLLLLALVLVTFVVTLLVVLALAVLLAAVARKAGLKLNQITSSEVLKRSLDARGKEVLYRYRVRITSGDEPLIEKYTLPDYQNVANKGVEDTVIIVGAGPSGLFA